MWVFAAWSFLDRVFLVQVFVVRAVWIIEMAKRGYPLRLHSLCLPKIFFSLFCIQYGQTALHHTMLHRLSVGLAELTEEYPQGYKFI